MLQESITLSYEEDLPLAVSLKLDTQELFGVKMRRDAETLFKCYEQDILYIPKKLKDGIVSYLQSRYGRHASKEALDQIRNLEPVVFAPIKSQLDKYDFSITSGDLLAFFQKTLDDEFEALRSGQQDPTLAQILSGDSPERDLTRLLVQFSIEFLTEGCPMGLYGHGVFGELQSYLFKVYQDEMGNGVPADKHSHLYEATMRDLGLSDIPHAYSDYYLTSNYLVSDYTYSLCHDKRNFFRYLGALFRNEACFISWQKQLGEAVRTVFGGRVDCRYFDVHTEVDQAHGRWVLQNLVERALKTYGDEVAGEILRGFAELEVYQDLFDIEFRHTLGAVPREIRDPDLAEDTAVHVLEPGQAIRIYGDRDVVVRSSAEDCSGEVRLCDPKNPVPVPPPGTSICIPKFSNVLVVSQ